MGNENDVKDIILKRYSISENDYTLYHETDTDITYQHKIISSYHITINKAPDNQGKITVLHTSDMNENREIWEIDDKGIPVCKESIPVSIIPDTSKSEYTKDLEKKIENLQQKYKELIAANTKRKVGRPQISEETTLKILQDSQQNLTQTAIAKKYGIQRKTVYNIIQRKKNEFKNQTESSSEGGEE